MGGGDRKPPKSVGEGFTLEFIFYKHQYSQYTRTNAQLLTLNLHPGDTLFTVQIRDDHDFTIAIFANSWTYYAAYAPTGWHYMSFVVHPNGNILFHFDGQYCGTYYKSFTNTGSYSGIGVNFGISSKIQTSNSAFTNVQAIRLSDELYYDTNNYEVPSELELNRDTVYLFDFSDQSTSDRTGQFYYGYGARTSASFDSSLVFNEHYTSSLRLYPGSIYIYGNR